MKKRTKSRIALSASAVFLLSAAAMVALLLMSREAAITPPSPNAPEAVEDSGDGFPEVDWAYWQGINPDVIGWVTIPGTSVNSPILQAHADAPEYYLRHDVHGNYNPHGCIYLDAACEELGLSSRNVVIMGHHFWNDTVAAPMGIIASYTDEAFAREHANVLIQTPTAKMTYEARFAQIVNGRERNKRIDFEGEADFRAWYGESRANAAMVLDSETEPKQVISLVTCSYNIWVDNERTVLVTSMQETAKNQAENTQIAPDAS